MKNYDTPNIFICPNSRQLPFQKDMNFQHTEKVIEIL